MVVREKGKFFVSYDSGAHGSSSTIQPITEQDFNAVKSGNRSINDVVKQYHFR